MDFKYDTGLVKVLGRSWYALGLARVITLASASLKLKKELAVLQAAKAPCSPTDYLDQEEWWECRTAKVNEALRQMSTNDRLIDREIQKVYEFFNEG